MIDTRYNNGKADLVSLSVVYTVSSMDHTKGTRLETRGSLSVYFGNPPADAW